MATKGKTTKRKAAVTTKRKPSAATKRKAAEAQSAAKHGAVLATLKPIATEINAMLANADKSALRADDLRLSAAVHLDSVKTQCKDAGLNFKGWCKANVKQAYETVRQLVRVGGAPDPRLALEDMRAQNAKRNRKARAVTSAGRVSNATPATPASTTARRPADPFVVALAAGKALPENQGTSLARELALAGGMAVVTRDEARAAHDAREPTIAAVQAAIARLDKPGRVKVLQWLTAYVESDNAADAGDPLALGPFARDPAPAGGADGAKPVKRKRKAAAAPAGGDVKPAPASVAKRKRKAAAAPARRPAGHVARGVIA